MAFELKLKDTKTINAQGTRVYLVDDTREYNALTNPTGYGGTDDDDNPINPTRESMALVVLGTLMHSKGNRLITFEPYNPLTTSTFNAVIGQDGWYKFQLIRLELFNGSVYEYNEGDILYDVTYYRIVKIVDTMDPSSDTVVRNAVEISVADLADTNFIKSTVETFFIANNSKVKSRINTQISNLIQDNSDFANKKLIRYKDNYNLVRAILQGAIYEYCRGNKAVAEKDIEFLNSNNYVSE